MLVIDKVECHQKKIAVGHSRKAFSFFLGDFPSNFGKREYWDKEIEEGKW